jgi:Mg-chelatase subunit ChlD
MPEATPAPPTSAFRCEVFGDPDTLARLRAMGADGRLSADHMMIRDNRARLILTAPDIARLREMGLDVRVGPDVVARARAARVERLAIESVQEADGLRTGFVTQYLDTAGIYARFAALHAEFAALTEWRDLPHPTVGYDGANVALRGPGTVKLFRITTTPTQRTRPGLLLVAGTHAREWMPPLAAIEFAERLLRNFTPGGSGPGPRSVNRLVEGVDLLIVPALNPDGMIFSHHDEPMWRKNRRPNPPRASPGCRGVDNNRNYSVSWGEAGSSGDPCNDAYRGPAALSEPENRNLTHVLDEFPNVLIAVDCHSFGEDIFRPHPSGGQFVTEQLVHPRDHAIYLELEAAMNAAISGVSPGRQYSTGTTNNHAGTCDDYLFLARRIFGFTLECGQEFQPPITEALQVVREAVAALWALGHEALMLRSRFLAPVNLTLVVDRSIDAAETARATVRRLVDLMSPNDGVAVLSAGLEATTHLPLTPISHPGVYLVARAAAAIPFGGESSLGAGLAAGAALAPGEGARAIVVVSDGHADRPPRASEVLSMIPSGTPVHVVTLGTSPNRPVLEAVTSATGGRLWERPDELGLHAVYQAVRTLADL